MAEIKVITIGRHYCAGGSTIGKLVAEKLGIPCYDREIIDMAAQKSGIAMSEIQKYEEAAPVSYTHLTLPTNREV